MPRFTLQCWSKVYFKPETGTAACFGGGAWNSEKGANTLGCRDHEHRLDPGPVAREATGFSMLTMNDVSSETSFMQHLEVDTLAK